MMEGTGGASPRLTARIGGVAYLLMFLAAGLGAFARNGLVVAGDAVATAGRILAHESMWRLGVTAELLVVATYLVVTAYFFALLKPVNRSVAFLAALFSLAGCIVQGFGCLFLTAPLVVLGRAPYLSVFKVDQLQALAYLFLKLYNQTYSIALVFFGFYCLLTGYLILKSTFLPRILGALMMLAGVGGLTFLSASFGARLFPYNMTASIAEVLLTLWLIVFGVNAQRWKEQAGVSERP